MIERVKQFFAAMASLTAFLYAAGYMAEFAHARLLGLSLVNVSPEAYLISGGGFIISTILSIYPTLVHYPVPVLLITLAIIILFIYETYRRAEPSRRGPRVYILFTVIMVLLMAVAVMTFIHSFELTGVLLALAVLYFSLVTLLLTVSLPINHGILVKSLKYPLVEVETIRVEASETGAAQTALSTVPAAAAKEKGTQKPPLTGHYVLLKNKDPKIPEHLLWLLREGGDELLFFADYFDIKKGKWNKKLFSLKRSLVNKIEVLGERSVLQTN